MDGKRSPGFVHLITVYPPEDIFVEGVLQTAGIRVIKRRESIAPPLQFPGRLHRHQETGSFFCSLCKTTGIPSYDLLDMKKRMGLL